MSLTRRPIFEIIEDKNVSDEFSNIEIEQKNNIKNFFVHCQTEGMMKNKFDNSFNTHF